MPVSADGVHFTSVGRVLPFFTYNPTIVDWDERRGNYVIFSGPLTTTPEKQRRIGRMRPTIRSAWLSQDRQRAGCSWGSRTSTSSVTDSEDDPHSDIYYNAATIYPWAATHT